MENGSLMFLLLFLLTVCLTISPLVEANTKTQSLRSILNHFTDTRNVYIDPVAKQRARDFIVNMFKDHGLHTWTEEFPSNQEKYPGVNVIGRLPGHFTGTRDDKMVLIGSHYDTVQTSPGVDDNGSGMTALLQALKLITIPDKRNCSRDHTLLFVAFDLEERQPTFNVSCSVSGNCSCPAGLCGSGNFVQNLTEYLNSTGASFQGAIILDTVLNYNDTPNSQRLPAGFDVAFAQQYQQVSQNQFRGDFLVVIGRAQDDTQLVSGITNFFIKDETFKSIAVSLISGRPSTWNQIYQNAVYNFFRSDHYRFWNAEPSLPAVFLTDSADFRGYMQQCYHENCDDISRVTPVMVEFLGQTADGLVEVATNMTSEKCQTKKTDCGIQQLTTAEGEIMTPYYNTEYPNSLVCEWIISVNAEQKDLRLTFTAFELEESVNCTADYVVMRNGKDKSAPLIGKYCGRTLPEPVYASAQSLYIMFHSDELDAFKGFKADWTSTEAPTIKSTAHGPPTIKSAAHDYHPVTWQLISFLVLTSLAIGQ